MDRTSTCVSRGVPGIAVAVVAVSLGICHAGKAAAEYSGVLSEAAQPSFDPDIDRHRSPPAGRFAQTMPGGMPSFSVPSIPAPSPTPPPVFTPPPPTPTFTPPPVQVSPPIATSSGHGPKLDGDRLINPLADHVPESKIKFPDLGPMPPTPLRPGFGPLPPVLPPATPPKDPGDYTAHCGATAVCSGQPTGPIQGPFLRPAGTKPIPGVDPFFGESAAIESGVGRGGSLASQANRLSFPTTIGLQDRQNRMTCSGVLVSERLILTAAHCTCTEAPAFAFFGETTVPARVRGRGFRTSLPLKPEVRYYHHDFCSRYAQDGSAALGRGDLALLTLRDPLPKTLADTILPVDPFTTPYAGFERLYVVGFGESTNRWRPGDKSYARLDFVSRGCGWDEQDKFGCRHALESAAAKPPADTCYGDSGGPLFTQAGVGEPMQLVGITSRSMTNEVLCGNGGIYVSLELYPVREWLAAELARPIN